MSVPAPFVYNATVVNVHDGDTINCDIDWGFRHHTTYQPVRLLGCNARELSVPGGKEARDHLAMLLPAGTPLVLATAAPDKYAPRWDAQVTYLLNGVARDLVADLIAAGWLAPWDGKGSAPVPMWPRSPLFAMAV